jgi:hypothetical protein
VASIDRTLIETHVADIHRRCGPEAYWAFAERWQRALPIP